MTTIIKLGVRSVSLIRELDGYRTYKVSWLVMGLDRAGPFQAANTAGLPLVGSVWDLNNVAGDGLQDYDPYVWCTPEMRVTIHKEKKGDPVVWWKIEQTFSNRPRTRDDTEREDPTDEPDKIWTSTREDDDPIYEAEDGTPATSSSREYLYPSAIAAGDALRKKNNKQTVVVEQVRQNYELSLVAGLMNSVNQDPIWGMAANTVRMVGSRGKQFVSGFNDTYWKRILEFEVDPNGHSIKVPDVGTKVLKSGGDPSDPSDYIQAKDDNDENVTVLLDDAGSQKETNTEVTYRTVDSTGVIYNPVASDFLQLGITPGAF